MVRDIMCVAVLLVYFFAPLAPVSSTSALPHKPLLWLLRLRGGSGSARDDNTGGGRGAGIGEAADAGELADVPSNFNFESLFDGCHLGHCMIRAMNFTRMEAYLRDNMGMQVLRKETFQRFGRLSMKMNSACNGTASNVQEEGGSDGPMTWGITEEQIR